MPMRTLHFSEKFETNYGISEVKYGKPLFGKPFIIFKIKNTVINNKLITQALIVNDPKQSVLSWAKKNPNLQKVLQNIPRTQKKIKIKIDKSLQLIEVIKAFQRDYTECTIEDKNQFVTLNWFKESVRDAKKLQKCALPLKYVDYYRLVHISVLVSGPSDAKHPKLEKKTPTRHAVSQVTKLPKKNSNPLSSQNIHFFKTARSTGKIIDIECAIAAYYRLFLGHERVPQTKAVYKDRQRVGLISSAIEGFVPFTKYDDGSYRADLVSAGIMELLVASYIFEENDLHSNNFGFNKQGQMVRIDFNESLFSSGTSEYVGKPTYGKVRTTEVVPKDAFPITERDIRTFPCLTDASPRSWIGGNKLFAQQMSKIINSHPHSEQLKWFNFLKAILLPRETIKNIPHAYIAKPPSAQKKADHTSARLAELTRTLINMPEFRDFILSQGDKAYDRLNKQFMVYNQYLKKPGQQEIKDSNQLLAANLEEIKEQYHSIRNTVVETCWSKVNNLLDDFKIKIKYVDDSLKDDATAIVELFSSLCGNKKEENLVWINKELIYMIKFMDVLSDNELLYHHKSAPQDCRDLAKAIEDFVKAHDQLATNLHSMEQPTTRLARSSP